MKIAPNIILKAMACGTPVLESQDDAIPDIIKNRETVYCSSEEISKNILVYLNYASLNDIRFNASNLVVIEYNLNSVLRRYKNLFSDHILEE